MRSWASNCTNCSQRLRAPTNKLVGALNLFRTFLGYAVSTRGCAPIIVITPFQVAFKLFGNLLTRCLRQLFCVAGLFQLFNVGRYIWIFASKLVDTPLPSSRIIGE